MNQNKGILKNSFHSVPVSYKIRGNIPPVKLHTFNIIRSCFHGLGFFNSNYTVFSYLFDSGSKNISDFMVIVCRNRGNMGNFVRSLDFLSRLDNLVNCNRNSLVHTPFKFNRGHSGGNSLQAFPNHRICKNSSCSGSVSSNIICLSSNFFKKLGTHVFKRIFQLNFPGNRNPVLSYSRSPEFFIKKNIPSLWAKCHLYGF